MLGCFSPHPPTVSQNWYGRSIVARTGKRQTIGRSKDMLIAAFIFVMSMAAVIQFAVLSWRAGLIRVASGSLAAEWQASTAKSMISESFANITAYSKLCPDIEAGSTPKLRSVRAYYRCLQILGSLSNAIEPLRNLQWTSREMALCTQYAAVTLAQRLERNQAQLASVRSF